MAKIFPTKKDFIIGDTSALDLPLKRKGARPVPAIANQAGEQESPPSFRLLELTGAPTLEWPPKLDEYDPRGHPSTANGYKPNKKAQDSKIGIAGNHYSIKGAGMMPTHSSLERKIATILEMNPYVIEIRAQYPDWYIEEFQKYQRLGKRFPKTKITTIDFVVTLKIPGIPYLLYHAISVKYDDDLEESDVRHAKEVTLTSRWSATHEVMTDLSVSDKQYVNTLRLLYYMRDVKNHGDRRELAMRFGAALLRTKIRGSLDRVLRIVGKRFDMDLDSSYQMFSLAHFFGFITWDHDYILIYRKPMILKRRSVEA